MFGGIVPVSGEVKRAWSEALWGAAGGYDIWENFLTVSSERTLDTLAAFGVCAGALVFRFTALRTGRLQDYNLAYIAFLVGIFGLAAGTVAKFAQTVLTMHPRWGIFSIYYVPGDLMMPLLLVVAWPLAARWMARFPNRKKLRFAAAPVAAALALGAGIALYRPFDRINEASETPPHQWRTQALAGTAIMNRILPDNSVIGSYDAGVVAYFSRFPVVNLDGLMNSYAYLREGGPLVRFLTMEYPQSRFGLTHLANGSVEAWAAPNGAAFAGAPYPENDFKVISVSGLSVAPDPEDAAASFWETMSPYFDYRSGNVGITTEGRLIHAIFRDCRPEEIRDTAFALSWTSSRAVIPYLVGPPLDSPNSFTKSEGGKVSKLRKPCRRKSSMFLDLFIRFTMRCCSSMRGRGMIIDFKSFIPIAEKVLPCALSIKYSSLDTSIQCTNSGSATEASGRTAASPRPIQHFSRAIFVGPTGARTDIRMSPASAILRASVHHFRATG